MADKKKSLYDRLKRLFATNVVVRNVGGKRLKVVDTSHYQSDGNPYQSKMIDRYGRIHGRRQSYSVGTYGTYNSFMQNKLELYADYEAMDSDPILHSALDLYSEETTTKSEEGDVLIIRSEKDDIKKILDNLFYDILNIEFNIRPWIRSLCKYGDLYLWMDIREESGIVNVNQFSAYEVTREEGFNPANPNEVRFVYEGAQGRGMFSNHEIAHFRLLGDTNFLPYGTSIIEGCRRLFKQLTLMEDAMLIHRIMRAPDRRVFKIDVGALPPNEIDTYMDKMVSAMKKVPFMDEQTGQYNLRYNMQNLLEDYFLAVRGSENGTSIETLPGLQYQAIEDIQYLQNKMFAALKIPKAFLGYDENTGGKATLAAEDVRFARTVEAIQRTVVSELTKIAIVHLYAQGYEDSDIINFQIEMTSPSIIYEQEKIELMKSRAELARQLAEHKMVSRDYIYKRVFNLNEEEMKFERNEVVEDTKQNFRLNQIENEGNDPTITNESYGTPHDMASLNVYRGDGQSTREKRLLDWDKNPSDNEPDRPVGRPKEHMTAYKTDDHVLGRDPVGAKASKKSGYDKSIKHKFRGNSPLALELLTKVPRVKSTKVLQESLKPVSKAEGEDTMPSILDESSLLDERLL